MYFYACNNNLVFKKKPGFEGEWGKVCRRAWEGEREKCNLIIVSKKIKIQNSRNTYTHRDKWREKDRDRQREKDSSESSCCETVLRTVSFH